MFKAIAPFRATGPGWDTYQFKANGQSAKAKVDGDIVHVIFRARSRSHRHYQLNQKTFLERFTPMANRPNKKSWTPTQDDAIDRVMAHNPKSGKALINAYRALSGDTAHEDGGIRTRVLQRCVHRGVEVSASIRREFAQTAKEESNERKEIGEKKKKVEQEVRGRRAVQAPHQLALEGLPDLQVVDALRVRSTGTEAAPVEEVEKVSSAFTVDRHALISRLHALTEAFGSGVLDLEELRAKLAKI